MAGDLVKLVQAFENIELRTDKDIKQYARLARAIGFEMYVRTHFHADELQSSLRRYKGRWYHFGLSTRWRSRLVASRLRIGAEGFKAAGIGGVQMAAAFERHFVQPEREARRAKEPGRQRNRQVERQFQIDPD
jgi:hypothetical protein